ncbi:MAG TPA: type I methionyl aminopeptidase [Patescibacteria group bacterium]|nr:type I methionyl aminopeptidase [Patescibacteria group bacterium]
MSLTKTDKEIDSMRRGGALLSRALKAAVDAVAPGVTLRELDAIGERVIVEGGGTPSFKGYQSSPDDIPFPSTICISVNEEVVHGLGNRDRKLMEGDIVGLDIGCWFEGLCTDMAVTVPVGNVTPEARKLMDVTRASLMAGVAAAKVGNEISDISRAVEEYVKPHGYGIVRALVGHGVGHQVHEAPHVPNYVSDRYPKVVIEDKMCLALEPMLGLGGDYHVDTAEDGWSIVMSDGSLGSHFEVTIAITKEGGAEILTPLPV